MESNSTSEVFHQQLYEFDTPLNATFIKPTGVAYYAVYSLFAIFGAWGNATIYYAIKHNIGFFGDRATFTLLVKTLSVLDIVLCCMIPVDMICLSLIERAYFYEYFAHPRNIVLIYESYILVLIAVDRYLAIKRPFSQRWTCRLLYKLMAGIFAGTALLDLVDISQKTVLPLLGKMPDIFIYLLGVTLAVGAMVITTYVLYFLLYATHLQYTRYIEGQLRSTRHAKPVGIPLVRRNSNGKESVDATTSNGPIRGPSGSDDGTDWFSRRRSSLRLVRVLFLVTSVYTVSMLPHFLAGWHLIGFPGYLVYHLFYLNAVANPIIYSANDPKLRACLIDQFLNRSAGERSNLHNLTNNVTLMSKPANSRTARQSLREIDIDSNN